MDDSDGDGARVCGGCRWIKGSGRWILYRLVEADGLIPLLLEADALRRQKFWCRREGCWVHLLDRACSLYKPRGDGDVAE